MDILIAFLAGIALAIGAVGLPGLLTTTTIETALKADRKSALFYGAGYGTTYVFQAGLALAMTTLVTNPEGIIKVIEEYALHLFILLAVVFLVRGIVSSRGKQKAKKHNDAADDKKKTGYYAAGLGVALVNFIALPYFFAMGTWAFQAGYVESTLACKAALSVGAGVGVMLTATVYTFAAEWLDEHVKFFTHNVNYFLVGLFVVLALVRVLGE